MSKLFNLNDQIRINRINEHARQERNKMAWGLQNTVAPDYGQMIVGKKRLEELLGRSVSPAEVAEAIQKDEQS